MPGFASMSSMLPIPEQPAVTIDPIAKAEADKKLINDTIESLTSDPNSTYVAEKVKTIMETICVCLSKNKLNWCNNAENEHPPVTLIGEYTLKTFIEFIQNNNDAIQYSLSHYGVNTSSLLLPDNKKGKIIGGAGLLGKGAGLLGKLGKLGGAESGEGAGLGAGLGGAESGKVAGLGAGLLGAGLGGAESGKVAGLGAGLLGKLGGAESGERKKAEVNDDKVRIPETPQTETEIDETDPLSRIFDKINTSIKCDPNSHELFEANIINSLFVSATNELAKNPKDKIEQMFHEIAKKITGQLINKEIEIILLKLDLLLYKIDHDTPDENKPEKETPEKTYINHLFQLYIFYKLNEQSHITFETLPVIDWTKYASSKCTDAIKNIGDIKSINESLKTESYIINETLRSYMQNKEVPDDIITTFTDVTSEASETAYKNQKTKGAQIGGGNKISNGRKSKRKRSALRNQNKRTRKPNMKHRNPK
jgi:S-adenosylmethionine/arginine decarboxylase-like enzyme